jgi:long-chain-alcohol oxidase
MASHDQSIGLLAGSCLGGGTVVNYTTSFRTPDDVREPSGRARRAGVHLATSTPQPRRGLRAARRQPGAQRPLRARPHAQEGLRQARLARRRDAAQRARLRRRRSAALPLRLPLGAKQSTMKTWLQDARRPARASSWVARRARDGRRRRRARRRGAHRRGPPPDRALAAVVAACGALQTPALLKRSGLANPNIGKHLKLHPATAVWGITTRRCGRGRA